MSSSVQFKHIAELLKSEDRDIMQIGAFEAFTRQLEEECIGTVSQPVIHQRTILRTKSVNQLPLYF
jgi:hypothetical protein